MYILENKKLIFMDDSFYNELEYINKGTSAKVYKIKIDSEYKAIKIFDNSKNLSVRSYKKKTNIKIPSFIFPEKLVFLKNKFKGYIMELFEKENIYNSNLEINISAFLYYADILYEDTDKLSKLNYIIQDESSFNTIFDNGFKLIDTDLYIDFSNSFDSLIKNTNDVKDFNKKAITRLLINIFIRSTGFSNNFFKNDQLIELKKNCIIGNISLEEFIYQTFNIINKNINYKDLELSKIKKINCNS